MRLRAFTFALTVSALALATVAGLPAPARAVDLASCSESSTVSAGVPDLLSSSAIGNPLVVNVPLIGTPDLFTGPSCSTSIASPTPVRARLTVNSVAGLVSGQMTISVSSPNASYSQTLRCGPAYGSCETSSMLYPSGPNIFVQTRCSVSGVVGALTSVYCSLEPTTF
jgi:hypothetical protein